MEKELFGLMNIQTTTHMLEIYLYGANISEFKPKENIYFVWKAVIQEVVLPMAIFGIILDRMMKLKA